VRAHLIHQVPALDGAAAAVEEVEAIAGSTVPEEIFPAR